ncbi:hypothetical protein TthWC1_2382 [Thermoanaerobacter thermohydrosulfuricus WC1]|uniref:Uncharacterized protein n=1 Tax=Thermoanaerobacter thermohydrosulfuricus WC1 TaxID=1198630 RepID=M8CLN8_THETY|nr:hypothetical protein [Thermoanaerobacter thermohydrosulfuricus]EMT38140.1 hypothetical protein TthWC1_2382 [Thermoanaerobacter thermohydrosulfuricus WC1]
MDRDKRQKASDVFQETNYLFAEKTTFEKAFPMIEDIEVKVIEYGEGVNEWNRERYYNKFTAGEYINCSNRLCYNGGFSLGRIIRYMVMNNMKEYQTKEICQGYEGSPKGRRKYRDCLNTFHITVKIKYKEKQEE